MLSNYFSGKRFLLLYKQQLVHNSKTLLYATIAYVGVIFILLSLVQMSNDFRPHDYENFVGFLIAFFVVFGILSAGYAFPAFRSKESTINYLMVPASTLEKFLSEWITRVGLMIVLLPTLYWVTFHMQGFFFEIIPRVAFEPISFSKMVTFDVPGQMEGNEGWFIMLITSLSLLGLTLPFTGATIFGKQPLIKSLFAVAVIILAYTGVTYVAIVPLHVGDYNPNDSMWFFPTKSEDAIRFFACVAVITNLIMLFVAYRKIIEKEV